jgi:hypothetical protein
MEFTLFCNSEFDQTLTAATINEAIDKLKTIMPLVKFSPKSALFAESVNKYDDKDWMLVINIKLCQS